MELSFKEYKDKGKFYSFEEAWQKYKDMLPDWASSFRYLYIAPDSRCAGVLGDMNEGAIEDEHHYSYYYHDDRSEMNVGYNEMIKSFYQYYFEEDLYPSLMSKPGLKGIYRNNISIDIVPCSDGYISPYTWRKMASQAFIIILESFKDNIHTNIFTMAGVGDCKDRAFRVLFNMDRPIKYIEGLHSFKKEE